MLRSTDAAARSCAMNYGCGSAIGCNEWPLLIRHRAVRKNTHAGPQRMPSANVPSCGQKRHTRWLATNSSACNELRMRQRDRMQLMTAADTPSCGQKKHTRWPATNSKYWCAIMRSEKTHTLACNEFFGMQWITDAAVRSDAMNDRCWYAIVRSEKTHTLARNEFQVLMCHHAVRKDTHAGLQRILRHAMNYGCGSAIGCNEGRLLIRHRAVRKDTHPGLQTNSSACNELRMRDSTRTNPWVLPGKKRISMRTCSSIEFKTTIRLQKWSGFGKPRVLCVNPGYLNKT